MASALAFTDAAPDDGHTHTHTAYSRPDQSAAPDDDPHAGAGSYHAALSYLSPYDDA